MAIKMCKRCGLVKISGRAHYCKECKDIVAFENAMATRKAAKERAIRRKIESGISKSLDEDVARIQSENEQRRKSGLPPLSYGVWRAMQEGRM